MNDDNSVGSQKLNSFRTGARSDTRLGSGPTGKPKLNDGWLKVPRSQSHLNIKKKNNAFSHVKSRLF